VTPRAGIVAVAAAALAYLATWALLFFVCLLNVAGGLKDGGTWHIASPNSWTLRAVYVAVAILVGLLAFRACRKWEPSSRQAAVPAGLALAAVLVVSGSMYAADVSHKHNYLKHLPPGMTREAGLVYGHQACDWLTVRPWGRPPGPDHLNGTRAVRGLVYQPHNVRWHRANSTDRLMVYYIEHLDAQHPGPLTQNERQQASVTALAWFELCPFQQWVHRPVGGSQGD
jgi:hypothetical protein